MSRLSISVAKINSTRANAQVYFNLLPINNLAHLAKVTTTRVWSPVVWRKGLRNARNYLHCRVAALDFDSGAVTIEDAHQACLKYDYCHIITTTKSHRVEKMSGTKISPAVDRFRLLLPLSTPMASDALQFKWQMQALMKHLPGSDKSCCDAGRFYWPGRRVAYAHLGPAIKLPPAPDAVDILRQHVQITADFRHKGRDGWMPAYIKRFLADGAPAGERRPHLFKVAAGLSRLGRAPAEIKSLMIRSPWDRTGISQDEAMRHINRGIEAANNELEAF